MEQNKSIEIVNLADHMEHFETVCNWLWKEWGAGKSLDYVRYQVKHLVHKDRVPMVFVAVMEGVPVASVSVWTNDLRSRQDLYPWLASLYVSEPYRNRGIGSLLQDHAVQAVRALGYKNIYLFTSHDNYYEKLGWTFMEHAPKLNEELTKIYYRNL